MVYLDTSVLAAYYCPEPLSQHVEKRMRSSSELAISELTEVELSSAVARKVRERELDRQDALRILAQFHAHLESGRYHRLNLSVSHYRMAKGWLNQMEWPLRTLDALHLAVAGTASATLMTSDVQLANCAQGIGLPFQLLSVDISR
jgi:predicted nucleic acid-binding protein